MMNQYEQLKKDIAAKVEASGSRRSSKGDFNAMATTLINTPEAKHEVLVPKQGGNAPEVISTTPVKEYRDALKGVVKQFGVDTAELGKLDDLQFSKAHGEAIGNLAGILIHDTLQTGRKYQLPQTSIEESVMELSMEDVAEKVEATKKIEQQADGSYLSVPTGKTIKTKKHKALKAKNKVPYWMKQEV